MPKGERPQLTAAPRAPEILPKNRAKAKMTQQNEVSPAPSSAKHSDDSAHENLT
jgi:hypothetical protein